MTPEEREDALGTLILHTILSWKGQPNSGALAYQIALRVEEFYAQTDTTEWAVQTKEFMGDDEPWDRIDDGRSWSHRYGRGYTEEEIRVEVARRINGHDPKDWRRVATRRVSDWVPEVDTEQ